MSEVLRKHVRDFGFTHAEIARRSARLNQATAYRVVEGETTNPSLKSITGIVEATSLTDADAGVLYRRLAVGQAVPKRHRPPEGVDSHEDAAVFAKDALDSGKIRDAAYGVMAMFDLALDDEQTADAYEQAGIVYMGLGRWEEAQVNFEAADALLHGDIRDPSLCAGLLNRKLTLMTNLGSLMAKRGNASWAVLFGQQVAEHPRATANNRGWGLLVQGEASMSLNSLDSALEAFEAALACFEDCARQAEDNRALNQARGNALWARVHVLYARGDAEGLADLEAEQVEADPEVAAMAGLFHALCLQSARRKLKLRDVQARARRHGLGEIAQRATQALAAALVLLGLGLSAISDDPSPVAGPDVVLERGNTGGGK